MRSLLLYACALLCGIAGFAQTTSFINYGVEQGLSQSQVQTITQDNEGNLWIGTLSGLTKYNGKNFTIYSRNDGLAEDWITSSYKDKEGNIWFGHWAGGVSRYDFSLKQIDNLNLEEYTRFKTVTCITQDDKGKFWIATEGSGIFIYEPRTTKMSSLSKDDGLASDNVYAICTDMQKNMWIATDNGLTIYDKKADISSSASFTTLNTDKGLASNHVTALSLVNGNEMWVGTADAGVTVMNLGTGFTVAAAAAALTEGSKVINASNELGSNFIENILEDRDHTIWIGTTGGGVTRCMPAKAGTRIEALDKAIFYTYSTRQGLNYFNANEIFQDREGSVWIGTDIGLNQYRGERFQIYDEADSLINNLVWSILCDSEGAIWLGTNEGISKITFSYSPKNNKQMHSIQSFTDKEGLTSNVILSSFEDSKGNLWFGTGFGGVCRLAKGENKFTSYTKENGLAGNVVFSICEDDKGNMWFGTKEGASKLDPATGTIRNYNIADGLGGSNVYRIFKDSRGNLWFGALGGSLSMYDGTSFRKYNEDKGMNHRFILCITEDYSRNLWFGAYGGGMYRYDGKEFKNYSLREGMTTESPYSLIADKEGNIWVGNTRGIDKFDLKKETFYHYGKAEGFLGVETNPNASCRDKEGNLWFGTIMGAVRFCPKEDKPNNVEPQTFITGLRIFMKDTVFPYDGKFYYDQNHLTFQFVGVSLTNPEKVLYQFKLDGFDKEWIPGYTNTTHNEAVYSNVPPGTYIFMVRACNNDGLWNNEPTKYKFTVKPPFWQTSLFFIVMALFILFCLYGADRIRTKNLQSAKKQLEEKVKTRTTELARSNAELAEKNTEITDSIRYAKRLQDAIIPPPTIFNQYFADAFVLFKPKDIVSGDFYWLEGKKGGPVLVGAVDCTGHGVPGAFMSIVAHNLLEKAVEELDSLQPSHILDHINKALSDTLQKSGEELQVKDGMDIALCSINADTMELMFAGAYNPAYIVRKDRFSEIKGDTLSMGSYKMHPELKYTNHKIPLQKGDTIYIFSDGYADQFGGPSGKKFKYQPLQQLLMSIYDRPMNVQRDILDKTIEEWRGELEQVDDILIIGIRI